jgi:hypothetical protein
MTALYKWIKMKTTQQNKLKGMMMTIFFNVTVQNRKQITHTENDTTSQMNASHKNSK